MQFQHLQFIHLSGWRHICADPLHVYGSYRVALCLHPYRKRCVARGRMVPFGSSGAPGGCGAPGGHQMMQMVPQGQVLPALARAPRKSLHESQVGPQQNRWEAYSVKLCCAHHVGNAENRFRYKIKNLWLNFEHRQWQYLNCLIVGISITHVDTLTCKYIKLKRGYLNIKGIDVDEQHLNTNQIWKLLSMDNWQTMTNQNTANLSSETCRQYKNLSMHVQLKHIQNETHWTKQAMLKTKHGERKHFENMKHVWAQGRNKLETCPGHGCKMPIWKNARRMSQIMPNTCQNMAKPCPAHD